MIGDTAKLIAQLNLTGNWKRQTAEASRSFGSLERASGKTFQTISKGAVSLVGNLAKIGAGVAVLGGIAIKQGLSDLAELESAITSVDGSIEQMGLTGKVTGKQIADWANQIEADIGAAFDDKAITQATSTLIRFGRVTEGNIRPAMQVIADLATKTGSVESAATLLAKALADPTKAAGKLTRAGVILTKAQQDQIKAMVEAGDVAGAQAVLLDAVAKSTAGAAEASQGKYARAMSVLADVSEDAKKALAEGFLPVLERVADILSKELAKPATMANIREFGNTMAKGLDSLISIAQKLPWEQIGQSLQLAGTGAKAVLGAFASLPPWVQTAVLTGWGLNKLTGGALGSLVGELGKGLIKGVLGITAGVVHIKAATVTGAGGAGGAAAAGGKGVLGKVGGVVAVSAAVVGWAEAVNVWQEQNAASSAQASGLQDLNNEFLKNNLTAQQVRDAIAGVDRGIEGIRSNPLNVLVQGDALAKLEAMRGQLATRLAGIEHSSDRQAAAQEQLPGHLTRVQLGMERAGSATVAAIGRSSDRQASAVASAASGIKATTSSGFSHTGSRLNAGFGGVRTSVSGLGGRVGLVASRQATANAILSGIRANTARTAANIELQRERNRYLQKGGLLHRGQSAWVGEKGAERITAGRSMRVTPAGNGGGPISVTVIARSEISARDWAREQRQRDAYTTSGR